LARKFEKLAPKNAVAHAAAAAKEEEEDEEDEAQKGRGKQRRQRKHWRTRKSTKEERRARRWPSGCGAGDKGSAAGGCEDGAIRGGVATAVTSIGPAAFRSSGGCG